MILLFEETWDTKKNKKYSFSPLSLQLLTFFVRFESLLGVTMAYSSFATAVYLVRHERLVSLSHSLSLTHSLSRASLLPSVASISHPQIVDEIFWETFLNISETSEIGVQISIPKFCGRSFLLRPLKQDWYKEENWDPERKKSQTEVPTSTLYSPRASILKKQTNPLSSSWAPGSKLELGGNLASKRFDQKDALFPFSFFLSLSLSLSLTHSLSASQCLPGICTQRALSKKKRRRAYKYLTRKEHWRRRIQQRGRVKREDGCARKRRSFPRVFDFHFNLPLALQSALSLAVITIILSF